MRLDTNANKLITPEYITSADWKGSVYSFGDLVSYPVIGGTVTGIIYKFEKYFPDNKGCSKLAYLLTNENTHIIDGGSRMLHVSEIPGKLGHVDMPFFIPEFDKDRALYTYNMRARPLDEWGLDQGIQATIRAKGNVDPSLHLAWSEDTATKTPRRIDLRIGLNGELPPSVFIDFQPFKSNQEENFSEAKNEIPNIANVIGWLDRSHTCFYRPPFDGVHPNWLDDIDGGDPFYHQARADADPKTQTVLKVIAKLESLIGR